jgi:hypothetical protein
MFPGFLINLYKRTTIQQISYSQTCTFPQNRPDDGYMLVSIKVQINLLTMNYIFLISQPKPNSMRANKCIPIYLPRISPITFFPSFCVGHFLFASCADRYLLYVQVPPRPSVLQGLHTIHTGWPAFINQALLTLFQNETFDLNSWVIDMQLEYHKYVLDLLERFFRRTFSFESSSCHVLRLSRMHGCN